MSFVGMFHCTVLYIQWNPSEPITIGEWNFVLYREVSLTRGLFCVCIYVMGSQTVSFVTEVSLFQGCPLREVPLYIFPCVKFVFLNHVMYVCIIRWFIERHCAMLQGQGWAKIAGDHHFVGTNLIFNKLRTDQMQTCLFFEIALYLILLCKVVYM